MNVGKLNWPITIQTLVITKDSNDHDVESWSEADTVMAEVTWVDGTRIFQNDELKDRKVAKIRCWDNNYNENIRIGLDDLLLYPIKPLNKNYGTSNRVEVTFYVATKAGSILTVAP